MTQSVEKLKSKVEDHLERLELTLPWHRSKRFKEVSYEKSACREILREIQKIKDAPLDYEALDILYKMKAFYDSAPGKITVFSVGADLIDDLINDFENE